ncbi:class II fructose-1,6-bisphosphate aldolase [Brevibacillus sp. NRS-1366]|uniref:class II fructose-1,6-bisphosphate aldolase n=1 Tax=Brevibacillus sp. NRS-1366 TaxID=3233899 RepID=UPI003D1D13B2
MQIVSMKSMLYTARANQYAVGQFNVNNLEFAQAFLQAAKEEDSPVILGITEAAVRHMGGYSLITAMVKELMKEYEIMVPVALHLDHSSSMESCVKAIHAGFTSVMIDGSHLSLPDNIAITRRVVEVAKVMGVTVEAEIGRIAGEEDGVVVDASLGTYAAVKDCEQFIYETNVDCLAPALGSVHGQYKGEPRLRFDLLDEIVRLTGVPCALHGGTGIPSQDIKKAITLGVSKINVNTENQMVYTAAMREALSQDPAGYEVRNYARAAMDAIKASVKGKMREFGSSGQAETKNI